MADDPDMRPTGGAEQRWRRALERQPELRKLIETPTRSRSDVEAAAHRLGLHISTLYRLLRRASRRIRLRKRSRVKRAGGARDAAGCQLRLIQ